MDPLTYVRGSFNRGVWALATGTGRIQERLAAALIEIAPALGREVPQALQEQWEAIGRYSAAECAAMQDDAAVRIAQRIVNFYDAIIHHIEAQAEQRI